MATIKNHEKLTMKALECTVETDTVVGFRVTSPSGSEYRVVANEVEIGGYGCTCKWGQHHPNSECSHVKAVQLSQLG